MSKPKNILVATREITGGTEKHGIATLKAQGELTAAVKKSLGLDDEAVDSLIESGALITVPVHLSDEGDNRADLAEANGRADKAEKSAKDAGDRADKAEQDLAAANDEIASLKTQLEAAQKALADATKK